MRNILVLGLLVMVVCTAAVTYGGQKNDTPRSETNLLASEMAAKIVYRKGTTVTVSAPNACLLHINFEPLNASFDLPLQDATVIHSDGDDSIAVQSAHMTRKIKDRAPEAFERLTLRFNRLNIKSVVKTFTDAISACNQSKPAVVAAN